MLMIRFQRIGRKNDASFRIAVLEKTAGPKAGKYVDLVGSYNPKTKAATINGERVKDWVAKGAQVSPTAMNLFIKEGVYEGKKFPVVSKKNLEKNNAKREEEAAAAKAAAEEAARAAAEAAAAPAEPVAEVVEEAPAEVVEVDNDPVEAAPEVVEDAAVEETAEPAAVTE